MGKDLFKEEIPLVACCDKQFIDFHVNNGTKIAITLDPLTFILSPVVGGEDKVRGM